MVQDIAQLFLELSNAVLDGFETLLRGLEHERIVLALCGRDLIE